MFRIALPPNSSPDFAPAQCLAVQLDSVISRAECDAFVVRATPGLAYAKQFRHEVDGESIIVPILNPRQYRLAVLNDAVFADRMWQRLQRRALDAIAPWARARGHGEPLGLCGRLRVLCYSGGEDRFDAHYDRIVPEDDGMTRSLITVLVYLNDGGGDEFDGGETVFLNAVTPDDGDAVAVTPRAGRVVLFEHQLYHTGSRLAPGCAGAKYVMRTDVMFAAEGAAGAAGPGGSAGGHCPGDGGGVAASVLEDVELSVAVTLRRVAGLSPDTIDLLDKVALIMSLRAFRMPGRACVREMVADALGEEREAEVALIVEAVFGPDGSAKVDQAPDVPAADQAPDEEVQGDSAQICSMFDDIDTSSDEGA